MNIQAFHSFWTAPNRGRHQGKIVFPDYELLSAMLSALKWREYNGTIRMITDSPGAEYFIQNGLENLWDTIDTRLDDIPPETDPFLFWAAGKLYALASMPCPCVMLDTDLIIWKSVQNKLNTDIVTAHSEELYPDVYPDVSTFHMKSGYEFPSAWDYRCKAANTAFLYIRHQDFRDYYVSCARTFMQNIIPGESFTPITAMCFAEQRILPMCAREKQQSISCLLELSSADQQDFVTHIWGYKNALNVSEAEHTRFCVRCVDRIRQDYPEYEEILAKNPRLSQYMLQL